MNANLTKQASGGQNRNLWEIKNKRLTQIDTGELETRHNKYDFIYGHKFSDCDLIWQNNPTYIYDSYMYFGS